ncbi:bifunctional diguanylate cyclase/phosphodiesterase [Pseudokineococcus marinus]|uniref:Bifunctional diguanylate cyclase/phosphodiesterase n=1 Tax=Pseudokineococcus marinus TaxID=351215 RepID=A0A849BHG9_9ACTN|nr:bifunctional diguanylate cyclase/phosphodiesterase [Pseudokineococcus marinus]NNH22580.1 bifunctional diguanylate cyclase/phosphodiesterase [Pseudokineococcus marinus]
MSPTPRATTAPVEPRAEARPRRRRAGVGGAAAGLVAVAVLGAVPGGGTAAAALYSVLAVAGVVLVLVGAARRTAGRAPWLLLGAGAAVLVGGQLCLLWLVPDYDPVRSQTIWLHGLRGHPWAFAVGLVAYPVLYLGLVLLLRERVARVLPSAWLDGAVTAVLLAALSTAFVVPEAARELGLGAVGALLLSARPLLDLLLAAFALVIWSLSGWRADRRLPLVSAAFAVLLASDTAGALQVAGLLAGGVVGPAVDLGRLSALLLVAAAATSPAGPASSWRSESFAVVVTPVVGLSAGVALLVADQRHPLPGPAALLALGAVALVGVKLLLVIREVVALAGSHRLAMTDDLTGLGNLRSLQHQLDELLDAERPVALVLLDADGVGDVDERYGRATGDALLRHLGALLDDDLPPGAHLAHLGGGEFAALLPGAGPAEGAAAARAALDRTAGPLVVEDRPVRPVLVAGVAASPGADGLRPAPGELLRRAEAARRAAERGGDGVLGVYDGAVDAELRARQALLDDLRVALGGSAEHGGAGDLVVHYQPQVAAGGEVVGVEALVRWHHPRRGLVPPDAFLGLVEDHGLMEEVTTRVLRRAVADAVRWRDAGRRLRVSVNLSTTCLVHPGLLPLVDEVLGASGLEPADLVLEVTETTLMADAGEAVRTARCLVERGLGLSIDDYGTGYASMTYLTDLPATEVKLDRSFTARLLEDDRAAAVVRATVDLAHRLGLRLVAEGVEDGRTLAALRDLGVDETQGYLHSRPLALADLERWLDAQPSGAGPVDARPVDAGPSDAHPVPRPRGGAAQTSSR